VNQCVSASDELRWTHTGPAREVRARENSKAVFHTNANAMREAKAWVRCPHRELCFWPDSKRWAQQSEQSCL